MLFRPVCRQKSRCMRCFARRETGRASCSSPADTGHTGRTHGQPGRARRHSVGSIPATSIFACRETRWQPKGQSGSPPAPARVRPLLPRGQSRGSCRTGNAGSRCQPFAGQRAAGAAACHRTQGNLPAYRRAFFPGGSRKNSIRMNSEKSLPKVGFGNHYCSTAGKKRQPESDCVICFGFETDRTPVL